MDEEMQGASSVGFVDGAFMPLAEMRIPVTDMGFQLSDMCYDAVHVRDGAFFRLEDHLDRFERSLAIRRYDSLAMDRQAIADVLHGCVARAGLGDAMVTFLATRGSPASAHKDLRTCRNRFMAWAVPYFAVVDEHELSEGCGIVIARTIRIPTAAVDPTVKNFGRLDFVQALFEAYDRDARYAVLLDTDGNVTEGRGWNIFALTDGCLVSPDDGVLEGVTRGTIMELGRELNIDCRLDRLPAAALETADEIFLTSTAGGVMPVSRVDGRPVGDGRPGPVTTRLRQMYWALHDDPRHRTPVRTELARAS